MSDSALQAKGNAVYQELTVDLSTAIGKLVTFSAGVPSVSNSATVPAVGLVLDSRARTVAGTTTYQNAIGILGGLPGPCRAMISATQATALAFGDRVAQYSDGTLIKDAASGARVVVGVCTDLNGGAAGDLAEITFFTPLVYTA